MFVSSFLLFHSFRAFLVELFTALIMGEQISDVKTYSGMFQQEAAHPSTTANLNTIKSRTD